MELGWAVGGGGMSGWTAAPALVEQVQPVRHSWGISKTFLRCQGSEAKGLHPWGTALLRGTQLPIGLSHHHSLFFPPFGSWHQNPKWTAALISRRAADPFPSRSYQLQVTFLRPTAEPGTSHAVYIPLPEPSHQINMKRLKGTPRTGVLNLWAKTQWREGAERPFHRGWISYILHIKYLHYNS